MPSSPAVKRLSKLKFIILAALLNRCGRLMMANLRMASEDRHSEAISIVDRSLHETAVKIIWLCHSKIKDRFQRYLADGLKNDVEFKKHILSNIKRRKHKIEIEKRMLKSIRRSVVTSQLSIPTIEKTPKLPDLFSMIREIGYADISYIVIQRMGSHHVHGTWTGLLANVIDGEDALTLREGFNSPHSNQLMFSSLIVLDAVAAFIEFVAKGKDKRVLLRILRTYRDSLLAHNSLMAAPDMQPPE